MEKLTQFDLNLSYSRAVEMDISSGMLEVDQSGGSPPDHRAWPGRRLPGTEASRPGAGNREGAALLITLKWI
jgi:hypothetical protein